MVRNLKLLLTIGSLLAAALPFAAEAADARAGDWATVQNMRYGFSLTYPGSVFEAKAGAEREEGLAFISRDGAARLAVATFENDGGTTLEEYRQHLLTTNYEGATIDFAPKRRSWFIVSGTRGTMHFYERVSFTCEGRFINSWALIYPVTERPFYDRIVEAVARSYSPGEGRTGRCD